MKGLGNMSDEDIIDALEDIDDSDIALTKEEADFMEDLLYEPEYHIPLSEEQRTKALKIIREHG